MNNRIITISFDLEEWFQVENLRLVKPTEIWEWQISSIEKNVNRILSILQAEKVKATFFTLGWIAERHPEMIKKIHAAGHEIASHGYGHQVTTALDRDELYRDIKKSKEILENIIGTSIKGYRAPNFSVNDTVVYILKELQFQYDSSYNPFQMHSRYGHFEKYRVGNGNVFKLDDSFYELPVSATTLFNKPFPIGGGAYFRIFPYAFFKTLVLKKIKKDHFYNFYAHPWEFEPEQPRVKGISLNHRLRHYTGLRKTKNRLIRLIQDLKNEHCHFMTISEYLKTYFFTH